MCIRDSENDRSLITALEDLRPGLEANVLELAERQDPKGMAAIAATLRKLETAELVNLVAFGLDCSPLEKQALLEAPEMLRRAEMLDRMLRFQIAESTLPEAPRNLH